MTTAGKVLIVLLTVLSLTFLGVSVGIRATHTNDLATLERGEDAVRSGEPLGLRLQLQQEQARQTVLQEQIDRLKVAITQEQERRLQALAKLEVERDQLHQIYRERVATEERLREQTDEQVLLLTAAHERLHEQDEEIENLEMQIAASQQERDAQFARLVSLTEELNQLAGELERVRAVQGRLAAQLKKAQGQE